MKCFFLFPRLRQSASDQNGDLFKVKPHRVINLSPLSRVASEVMRKIDAKCRKFAVNPSEKRALPQIRTSGPFSSPSASQRLSERTISLSPGAKSGLTSSSVLACRAEICRVAFSSNLFAWFTSLENSESVDQLIKSENSAARLILARNTNATGCNLISELYVSRSDDSGGRGGELLLPPSGRDVRKCNFEWSLAVWCAPKRPSDVNKSENLRSSGDHPS